MSQPFVRIATPDHVEPQTFHTLNDDLHSLFGSPCHQYYQPNTRDGVPSPRSIPSLDHFQSTMRFVQNGHVLEETEQSSPDLSLFSWNQSDSFSYYY